MAETCKVCILGDMTVGKTSFCHRFVSDNFTGERIPTKVMAQIEKTVRIGRRNIKFKIWDTAGDEKFRSVIGIYYRGANAVILVYDITKPETMDNVEYWLKQVRKNAGPDCLVVIVGNKSDLPEVIPESDGVNFAKERGVRHFRSSAKTGENVQDIFQFVGKNFKTTKPAPDEDEDNVVLRTQPAPKENSNCSC